jgi:hypothetical protein
MEKNKKEYKVAYKTYYNERLKKSSFHNKLVHPLYVQVTFDRVPIYFKSYYFDLFAKPKYAIQEAGQVFTPDVKGIIEKEENLAEFIIDKNLTHFSLQLFKKEYAFYSRDLLDIMEGSFLDYLFTFLQDEGLPFLADTIIKGAPEAKLYELIQDLKRSLNPELYKKLIENSFYYAPPYLPLYAFTLKPKRTPLVCLTVLEWQQPETKARFIDFFKNHYPGIDVSETLKRIEKWVGKE